MNMVKVETIGLEGSALDYVVAKLNPSKYGSVCFDPVTKRVYQTEGLRQIGVNFSPSTDWKQGGPIIEREKISVLEAGQFWGARPLQNGIAPIKDSYGKNPLIAAMRCYVASKLGDVVEIPEALAKKGV